MRPEGAVYSEHRVTEPCLIQAALGGILDECADALEGDSARHEAALRRIAQLCRLLGYERAPSDFFRRKRPDRGNAPAG